MVYACQVPIGSRRFVPVWTYPRNRWLDFLAYRLPALIVGKADTQGPLDQPLIFTMRLMLRFAAELLLKQSAGPQIMNVAHFSILCFGWLMPARGGVMACLVLNLQPLSAGGNGDLYLGQRGDNGEYVVVKYLREHHLPHARKAFAREIRILGRQLRGWSLSCFQIWLADNLTM